MSGSRPPLTIHRRLAHGAVLRHGRSAAYRAIEIGAGEPHVLRDDFGVTGPGSESERDPGRALACLAHITDLQLADVQSPTRFEFINAHFVDPRYAEIIPVQRPQEALTTHAVDATLRTLGSARGPATGLPMQLAVTTGDAIDNAQWNELQAFLALFDGGLVSPDSGGPDYEGVQATGWPGDIFWRPDGPGAGGPDFFRLEFGYPHHPGLLQRALREFSASGLSMPWLSCFGNHEALNQGVGTQTPGLSAAMTGDQKPVDLPEDFDHDGALALFTENPEAFMAGPAARSRPIRSGGRSPGGISSMPTCGPVRGHSATGSPNGTGWTAPPITSTTRPRSGSSRWTPTAWPAARPGAWTPARPAGWRPGWRRCTRPTAERTAARSGPARTTGW